MKALKVVGGLILCAGALFVSFAMIVQAASSETPRCNDPDVQAKVVELTNAEIAHTMSRINLNLPDLSIDGLGEVKELNFNKASGVRVCIAKTIRGENRGAAGYAISWQDKENGLYLVRLRRVSDILDAYGHPAEVLKVPKVAAVADPVPEAPAQAIVDPAHAVEQKEIAAPEQAQPEPAAEKPVDG